MPKIIIRLGKLWWSGKALGPVDKVYAFPGEDTHLGPSEVVVRRQTPERIDLVFAAGKRTVGCEVKYVDDLVGSWRSRRLHRQLATLREVVDVSCLVVRGSVGEYLADRVERHCVRPDLFWGDWVNWQTRGVYILPVPPEDYLPRLLVYRKALGTTGERALKGTDLRPTRERRPGWFLRRVPTVGLVKSAQLIERWGTTKEVMLAAERGEVAPRFGPALEKRLLDAFNS